MRALVCSRFAPLHDLRVEDVELPQPQAGEVRVQMRAAALNFMDTLIVQGIYQLKPPLPFSPGAEMAGVVTAAGAGCRFSEGDKVVYRGQYGSLSEERIARDEELTLLPDGIGWAEAAAMPIAYTTALHALRDRAHLQGGEQLLVLGAAGGVGLAAIQVGKAMGARVIAVAGGAAKTAICAQNGADTVIDHRTADLREAIRGATAPGAVGVVLDTVGGDQAQTALRSLGRNGRYLVVGFASGKIPDLPANLILVKNADVLGVTGDFSRTRPAHHDAMMEQLFDWMKAGVIRPRISSTFRLADAVEALGRLADRQVMGKVVVLP